MTKAETKNVERAAQECWEVMKHHGLTIEEVGMVLAMLTLTAADITKNWPETFGMVVDRMVKLRAVVQLKRQAQRQGQRRCRVCGCTWQRACTGADGEPCHWVAKDLCSACREQEENGK